MNRVAWFIICTIVGLELIAWGLLVPVHIRAVDAKVLEVTGAATSSLAEEGISLVDLEKTGPARLLLQAAQQAEAAGRDKLAAAISTFENAQPKLKVWGGAAPYLERVFEKEPPTSQLKSQPILSLMVPENARQTLTDALRHSRRPGVLEILQTRELTNTVIFPPARSASGQPLDATISITALLFQQDHFAPALRGSIQALVESANRSKDVQALEMVYLDLLALGKRLDWVQLVDLMHHLPDTNALRQVSQLAREKEGQWPIVYSAVHIAESPKPVVQFLAAYPATGLKDLTFALRAGSGAVRELLLRQKPVQYPTWREKLVQFGPIRAAYEPLARLATRQPVLAFLIKYGLCLLGALLVARAVTYLSPALVEEIVQNRPFLTGPQVAVALCLLFVVLFFSESFVMRASTAKADFPIQIRFPVASAAVRATISHQARTMIDKFSYVALLTFFVLQAVIYVFCRMKLAEIRRQTLPSKLKLRLLENEEHLFDAGLYFGFVGTVLSLILVSIGISKFSLMAAYSSTSFGIIFVSILKIFHVRPYRRRLILDADMAERELQAA